MGSSDRSDWLFLLDLDRVIWFRALVSTYYLVLFIERRSRNFYRMKNVFSEILQSPVLVIVVVILVSDIILICR